MIKQADGILTADMHLRLSTPIGRTDDFVKAQQTKMNFISDLQREHNCPVYDAGDVFNSWKSSPELEAWAIKNLPDNFITIPGNHEIPSHNLNLFYKSSLHVIEVAGKAIVLQNGLCYNDDVDAHVFGFGYGEKIKSTDRWINRDRQIA